MFDLAVVANGMEDQNIIKATFLSQVGLEVYQIIKANLDLENEETTLEVIKTRLEEVLVTPRSEYTEICAFRRAVKERDETVNEYAIRLRKLARHCNFGDTMEKELERQFVVSCGTLEVERECVRTDGLTLERRPYQGADR